MRKLTLLFSLFIIALSYSNESYLDEKWSWEKMRVFSLSVVPEKSTHFDDLNGYSNVDLADLYIQLPVIRNRPLYIGVGAWYRQIYADLANFETTQSLHHTTHVLRGVIGSAYRFTPRHFAYAEYQIGIDGKWNNLTWDIINHRGVLFYGFVPKKDKLFRVGAIYMRLYGKDLLLPLAGTSFAFGKRSAFELLIPSHLLYRVRLASRVETGINSFVSTGDFGTEDIENRPVILSFTQLGSTLYGDFKLIHKPEKKFSLRARLELGVYYLRTTTLNELDGSEIMRAHPKPSPLAALSLRWAI